MPVVVVVAGGKRGGECFTCGMENRGGEAIRFGV